SARPKGVVLTYRELLPNSAATAQAFGLGAEDRIYDYRSFNWASAQMLSALGTLSVGATLLLGKKFSRSRFFADIAHWKATVATGNPTVLNMLQQGDDTVKGADLPHLRFITSSSAPLLVEEWRRFEARFGIPVAQGYGSSETGWIAGCTDRTRRHGSVGKPLAYLRAAIVAGSLQARSAMSRSAPTTIARSATSARTAASASTPSAACAPATWAFSTRTDTCISPAARRTSSSAAA